MTRITSIAGRLVLAALVLAQVAAAGEAGQFLRLFNHYNSIRVALAADTTSEVKYHAEQLGVLARVLAGEARRSGGEKNAVIARQLQAISDAARQVAYSASLKAARSAFAQLSRALLAYRGEAAVEDPVVVFCPLHNNVWLQRSEDRIGNPYLGEKRATCGETLKLRKPLWLPSRPPLGSPDEQSQQGGGTWGGS